MSIQDLSVELMGHILGYCAESDLLSVLSTCRGLRRLTEPLLYENISFSYRKNPYHGYHPLPEPFELLLKSLLHRPSLGTHVKRLTLPGKESWGGFKLAPIDVQAAVCRGSEVTPIKNEQWIDALREDSKAPIYRLAVTVLLLSYCDNLQSLALTFDPCHVSEEMGTSILSKIGKATLFALSLSKLQNLKELVYVAEGLRGSISYRSALIKMIYSLPRIGSLTLSVGQSLYAGTGDYQPRLPNISYLSLSDYLRLSTNTSHATTTEASPTQLVAPTLKTLRLQKCEIREKAIGPLLNRSPTITSLELDVYRDCDPRNLSVPSSVLDCTELGAQISHPCRKRHLEHLTISINFFNDLGFVEEIGGPLDGQPMRWGIIGSIGESFKDFTALKTLEIDLPVLLGWYPDRAKSLTEVLPTSLEELRIRNYFYCWYSSLWTYEAVVNSIKVYLGGGASGNLREITCFLDDEWKYLKVETKEALEACRKLCMEAGIRFNIV